MAYEFHYTPTGTGVISGKEVLEQTEDAINDLGNTAISGVQEALDKAEQALTNSANAVDDAQTALNTANNAEGVAIQAQNDVSTLSGTVTNIGNRVTTAEGNISSLQGRMTTAEGNITNLQGRMTTAEGNIGNLQTAVSTAQATANSAQQTATTARQQSYVFRYSSTTLVDSSTNSNALLDNTDNLKVGDKVIDSSGVLFSITAIDTANSTFTIGTALIDLAQDSDVVHKSGNETIDGEKTFSNGQIRIKSLSQEIGVTPSSSVIQYLEFADKNDVQHGKVGLFDYDNGTSEIQLSISDKYNNGVKDPAGTFDTAFLSFGFQYNGTKFLTFNGQVNNSVIPLANNAYDLGTSTNKWKSVYATNYYYGNDNVEFSTKFVTTDTAQTISGNKTFSSNVNVYNSDNTADIAHVILKNQKAEKGGSPSESQIIYFTDKSVRTLGTIRSSIGNSGQSLFGLRSDCVDSGNNNVYSGFSINSYKDGIKTITPYSNGDIAFGTSTAKWKSFNGVEPSSLSLPSDRSARIDISSYFTNLGNGDNNSYDVPANGYIFLHLTSTSAALCFSQTSGGLTNYAQTFVRNSGDGLLYAFFPVRKDDTFIAQIWTSSTAVVQNAYFIPCQGNV